MSRHLCALSIFVLCVAWWLRLATVAPYTIGTDGGLSVGLAAGSLHQLFFFNARDVHPPLYYLLLRYWIRLAGVSWVALKWPSAAAGVVAASAAARWARQAVGKRAGVSVLLAVGIAPSAVINGASVRDFSCGLAATMVATLAFWLLIRGSRSRLAAVGLALATSAAGLIWYFHLPVFAVQAALALLWRPAARARLPLLAGAATWLPWFILAGPALATKVVGGINSFGTHSPGAGRPTAEVLAVAGGWYPGDVPAALAAAAVLGAAGFGAVVGWRHGLRFFTLFWLACAACGGIMLWYVNGHWDPQAGIDRYGLVVLPFVAVGVSALTLYRSAVIPVTLLWAAVAAPNLVQMPHATPNNPWYPDPALDYIIQNWRPGDAVAFESIDRLGYFAVRGGDVAAAFAAEDNGGGFRSSGAAQRIATGVPRLEATHTRIWYVDDANKRGHLLQAALDRSASLVSDRPTQSGDVRLYDVVPAVSRGPSQANRHSPRP